MGKGKKLAERQVTDSYEVRLTYLRSDGYWMGATVIIPMAGKSNHDAAAAKALHQYGPTAKVVSVIYR